MNEFKPDDLLVPEYVLGTLRGGARRRFEQQISAHSSLARKVADWQQIFAELDLQDAPVQPPDRVWQAISARLPPVNAHPATDQNDAANQHVYTPDRPLPGHSVPHHARRNRAWQLTSAALAACLAIALFWPDSVDHSDAPDMVRPIAVLAPTTDGSAAHLVAAYDASRRSLVLTPLNMTMPDKQHSLQLWRIGPDKKPVSLGLLTAGASTRIELNQLATLSETTLAVSLEPAGGSPTGQPTGAVLYAGVVALDIQSK